MAQDMMGIAFLGAFMGAILLVVLIGYIYSALVMWTIGKKLKVEPTWLAWIPVVNMFYIPMLAGYEWYYGFLWLLVAIPFLGSLVSIGLTIWWWWKIAEERSRPGWWGILMIVPVVNLVMMGILAWSD